MCGNNAGKTGVQRPVKRMGERLADAKAQGFETQ